jgi:hypothetical protein
MNFDRRAFLSGGALALAAASPAAATGKRIARGPANGRYATERGPTFFIMGNWGQVPSSMAAWAARGINTAVTDTDDWAGGDGPGWRAACTAAGLKMILRADHAYDKGATNTFAADENAPLIIAHMTRDEPDLYIALGQSPPQLDAGVVAARALGSTKPFLVNFRNHVPGLEYPKASDGVTNNADFINMDFVNWQGSDAYSFVGLDPAYIFGDLWAQYGFHGPFSTLVGKSARTLYFGPMNGQAIEHPGRATFQFLATGRIGESAPGVPRPRLTAAQYRLQFWSCVVNGVCGILHFSHAFLRAGTILDDTDATMEGAIGDAVAKIAVLENQGGVNVLMDTVNGGRRRFTLRTCTEVSGGGGFNWPTNQPNFVAPTGNQLPAWFEGCEWDGSNGETYRLVVNLHDTLSKSLTDAAWGLTGNSFAAGQAKCFKASAPSVDIFA